MKNISVYKSVIIVIMALSVVFGGIVFLEAPSAIVLITGGASVILLSLIWGITWDEIEKDILGSLRAMLIPIIILLAVGMMIGSWMLSGTIPMLVYYGLLYLNPSIFIFATALICAIMTLMNGNSWATIGTVGIALMGVSVGLDVPLHYTAAAVVVGAIFGDKLSPLSDSTILASAVTDVKLMDHVKHLLYTTMPGFIISLVLYAILGLQFRGDSNNNENITVIISTLQEQFNLNPIMLLPPIVVLVLVYKRKPPIPVYGVGIFLGSVMAGIFQNRNITEITEALYSGFTYTTNVEIVDQIVQQGGLSSMLGTIAILISAAIFGAPLRTAGVVDILLEKIRQFAKKGQTMMASCLSLHALFFILIGSYYVTYTVLAPMLKSLYDNKGLHRKNLSRTLEDTGTALAPMVPWSVTGAFIASTLQVPNGQFILYAPMVYLGFILAFIYIYTGYGIAKSDDNFTVVVEQPLQKVGRD